MTQHDLNGDRRYAGNIFSFYRTISEPNTWAMWVTDWPWTNLYAICFHSQLRVCMINEALK